MDGVAEVTEVFVVVAQDEDGTWGIPALNHEGTPLPMLGLNPANAESFRAIIETPGIFQPSMEEGTVPSRVMLLRFTGIEVLKEVVP